MGILEKLQYKLELYRLEQRYAKRSKRCTFVSNADYVDGEYVSRDSDTYVHSPSSPKSSSSGWSNRSPAVRIKELAKTSTGRSSQPPAGFSR